VLSIMKSCVPKCWKSDEPKASATTTSMVLPSEEQKICYKCRNSQSVAKNATVFICSTCHAVNRTNIVVEGTVVVETSPEPEMTSSSFPHNEEMVELRRINSSTFAPLSDSPEVTKEVSANPSTIAPCSICLDAPGDMIFLSCNHGGFCEACARHIASNGAVGGACCVKCRASIRSLGRIVEVNNDCIKAVQVDLPNEEAKKIQPPRVPPPRGFNKSKKK
jgi:hypothetical protein